METLRNQTSTERPKRRRREDVFEKHQKRFSVVISVTLAYALFGLWIASKSWIQNTRLKMSMPMKIVYALKDLVFGGLEFIINTVIHQIFDLGLLFAVGDYGRFPRNQGNRYRRIRNAR